ncbi:hypothetical protein ABW20_dc0102343 [Dactylellina cionopaga]|nr:hypothetical protein ABW20_dc0102343 [Dactylellina cionopaga]
MVWGRDQEAAAMFTPAHSVLALPELLAEILLYLPFEDIMRSRGVSKTWLGVIDSDPELLWHTWRSPTPPTSVRKKLPIAGQESGATPLLASPSDSYFEPFRPFFERTLINTDEWTTDNLPKHPSLRILQRQFIRRSLAEFLERNATKLSRFYITRPPLKKIESSIRVIAATTGRRASLQSTLDRGFTITNEDGITVDTYLKALLECLENSWGRINIPLPPLSTTTTTTRDETLSGDEEMLACCAEDGYVLQKKKKKHRLEAQLLTMKKEYFDDDDDEEGGGEGGGSGSGRMTSREEWERGAMSSTLIIKVHYSVHSELEGGMRRPWWKGAWNSLFG